MNKIFQVLMTVLFTASSAYALEFKPKIGYGLLLNDVGSIGSNESQRKGGINAGMEVLTKYNDNLDLGVEAGYMQIYNWKYSTATGSSMELTYDAIPVLASAEYKFKTSSTFTPYAAANLGIFITGLKTVSSVAGIEITSDSSKNYIGGALGAGGIVNLNSVILDISVKYMFISDDTSEKTKLISVNLGVRFKT